MKPFAMATARPHGTKESSADQLFYKSLQSYVDIR